MKRLALWGLVALFLAACQSEGTGESKTIKLPDPPKEEKSPPVVQKAPRVDHSKLFGTWKSIRFENLDENESDSAENKMIVNFNRDLTYNNKFVDSENDGIWKWEENTVILDEFTRLDITDLNPDTLIYEFDRNGMRWRYVMVSK